MPLSFLATEHLRKLWGGRSAADALVGLWRPVKRLIPHAKSGCRGTGPGGHPDHGGRPTTYQYSEF
jgi:hypothetical protein